MSTLQDSIGVPQGSNNCCCGPLLLTAFSPGSSTRRTRCSGAHDAGHCTHHTSCSNAVQRGINQVLRFISHKTSRHTARQRSARVEYHSSALHGLILRLHARKTSVLRLPRLRSCRATQAAAAGPSAGSQPGDPSHAGSRCRRDDGGAGRRACGHAGRPLQRAAIGPGAAGCGGRPSPAAGPGHRRIPGSAGHQGAPGLPLPSGVAERTRLTFAAANLPRP